LGDGLTPSLTVILMLNVDRFTVKLYKNECIQWLCDSFRVHEIRFRPRLAPDPTGVAYSAPPNLLAGARGPTFKGECRGKRRERVRGREEEGKRRKGEGPPPPLTQITVSAPDEQMNKQCCDKYLIKVFKYYANTLPFKSI